MGTTISRYYVTLESEAIADTDYTICIYNVSNECLNAAFVGSDIDELFFKAEVALIELELGQFGLN